MTKLGKQIIIDLPKYPDEVIQQWIEPFAREHGWPLPAPILQSLFNQLAGVHKDMQWESIEVDVLDLPLSPYETRKIHRLYATAIHFIETEGKNAAECHKNLFSPHKFRDALKFIMEHETAPGAIILAERKDIDDAISYNIMDGNHRFVAYKYWIEHEHHAARGKQRAWIGKPQS